jgi:nucleotide-binding universal stress UspA family protein
MTKSSGNGTVFQDELARKRPRTYRLLVAIANPLTCGDLIDLAKTIVQGRRGEITALHVVQTERPPREEEKSAEARRTMLEAVLIHAQDPAVPIHTVTRTAPTIAQGIVNTAAEENSHLILMGWRGRLRRSATGASIGDVLDQVIKNAPCNIAVVKARGLQSIRRILVLTAGGPNAVLALGLAMSIARRYRAEVTTLYVAKPGQEATGRAMLAKTVNGLQGAKAVRRELVVAENAVKGILKEYKDYDLVLLGATQEGLFQQVLFGPIPEEVAKRCSKTVIVVKGYQPIVSMVKGALSGWTERLRGGREAATAPSAKIGL